MRNPVIVSPWMPNQVEHDIFLEIVPLSLEGDSPSLVSPGSFARALISYQWREVISDDRGPSWGTHVKQVRRPAGPMTRMSRIKRDWAGPLVGHTMRNVRDIRGESACLPFLPPPRRGGGGRNGSKRAQAEEELVTFPYSSRSSSGDKAQS